MDLNNITIAKAKHPILYYFFSPRMQHLYGLARVNQVYSLFALTMEAMVNDALPWSVDTWNTKDHTKEEVLDKINKTQLILIDLPTFRMYLALTKEGSGTLGSIVRDELWRGAGKDWEPN